MNATNLAITDNYPIFWDMGAYLHVHGYAMKCVALFLGPEIFTANVWIGHEYKWHFWTEKMSQEKSNNPWENMAYGQIILNSGDFSLETIFCKKNNNNNCEGTTTTIMELRSGECGGRSMTPNTPQSFARTSWWPVKTKESWLWWTFPLKSPDINPVEH